MVRCFFLKTLQNMDLVLMKKHYSSFRFKEFSLNHSKSTMKVCMDSLILGAFVPAENAKTILDIGSGCGILSLMLAQKSVGNIIGIDIDEDSVVEANENASQTRWKDRVVFQKISLQEFVQVHNTKFDLIISNPPFFNNSLKSKIINRNISRHTDTLPFYNLISCTKKILEQAGKFYIILPSQESQLFVNIATEEKLFCTQVLKIMQNIHKEEKRRIMCFENEKTNEVIINELVIRNEDDSYTKEYLELTKDYHLFSN